MQLNCRNGVKGYKEFFKLNFINHWLHMIPQVLFDKNEKHFKSCQKFYTVFH